MYAVTNLPLTANYTLDWSKIMAIKLIAIDLDGTLLNANHGLNPATIAAVKDAKAAGIKVVLCSGRPLTGVKLYLPN